MKTKFIYIALSSVLWMTSCSKDFLNRDPLDSYTNESLWSSEKDVLAAINGCYNNWEDGYDIIYMDAASDNAYNQYPWEGYTTLGNGYVTATDPDARNRWKYKNIQRCNWVLENIDKAPIDDELKQRVKGEAQFLRAYQYFMLTQLYGDVPLVTKSLSTEEANTISRTSKDEVQQFVLTELSEIADWLPQSYSGSDVGRVTKGAALALKARLELYREDYSNCIADCEKIMGLGYSLYPSYQDLFRIQNENNNEVILDIQYKENDFANENLHVMVTSSLGGWGSIGPTQALVDDYEMANGLTRDEANSGYDESNPYKNRDPRLTASIVCPGERYEGKFYNSIDPASSDYYLGDNNSKTGYLVKKFTSNLSDFTELQNNGLNMIVIRYAEILLTYAEAKIENGTIDNSVYDAIDAVRTRSKMPKVNRSTYNDQTSMRELVRRERRVELALEGLRWFDITRWKNAETLNKGEVYGARLGKVDATTGKLTLTNERIQVEKRVFDPAKNYLWPVPQQERDINKNLTQNPGY